MNKTKHSKRIISVITEMLLLHSSSNESIFLNAIYSPINTELIINSLLYDDMYKRKLQ